MINILFVADFFSEQIAGGGELNNDVFIKNAISLGHKVDAVRSHLVNKDHIDKADYIIVGNFVNMPEHVKSYLKGKKYVIYEHDHKYLQSRNPAQFENYLAPKEKIVNYDFYKRAICTFCQSQFHTNIARNNLNLDNIVNLGGNLWPKEHFSILRDMAQRKKRPYSAIMQTATPHKNMIDAIRFCKTQQISYRLIPPSDPINFLADLGQYETLVFFPKTPETLSRIVVEARMMGMKTKTTSNIGAVHEPWFTKKGLELIEYMEHKQHEITKDVLGRYHE